MAIIHDHMNKIKVFCVVYIRKRCLGIKRNLM